MAHRANHVHSADQAQSAPETLRSQALALAGLSTVFLFEMLDNSILNVALSMIARELHASATALQWVTGGYAVVFGSLMIPFGVLSDRVGRRRVMLIGLALLGLSSLATALVQSAWMLIAVRAAMGVAAAMTTPGSLALGIRLNGVVAGTNIVRGMPANRTTLGASLVDASSELATGVGVAAAGTVLAALFTGSLATSTWSSLQRSQFETATLVGGVLLTLVAAALVGWGYARSRVAQVEVEPAPAATG